MRFVNHRGTTQAAPHIAGSNASIPNPLAIRMARVLDKPRATGHLSADFHRVSRVFAHARIVLTAVCFTSNDVDATALQTQSYILCWERTGYECLPE